MVYHTIVPYTGRELLSTLADKGPKSEVERLLDDGADVNSMDWNKRTPLSHAAEYRQFDISQLLLERGATVDIRDLAGRTPLSFAAESDCAEIVKLLLDAGADVNSKCENGRTPLSYAAEGGNPQVILVLLQKGADRTIRDCEGGSALLTGYFSAVKNYEFVIALLKKELFVSMIKQKEQPELTELEAQVLNKDWSLKEGWDWIYDWEMKPLFFQSYKRQITTDKLCQSRMRRFFERGPWRARG
jgi:ankyrin repeat protein